MALLASKIVTSDEWREHISLTSPCSELGSHLPQVIDFDPWSVLLPYRKYTSEDLKLTYIFLFHTPHHQYDLCSCQFLKYFMVPNFVTFSSL